MALINIDTVIQETRRYLKKIIAPGGIELLSYKRNRSIAIIKENSDMYHIRENGYETEEVLVSATQLNRELKTRIGREFPRSHKVRLIKFQDPVELERSRQKI